MWFDMTFAQFCRFKRLGIPFRYQVHYYDKNAAAQGLPNSWRLRVQLEVLDEERAESLAHLWE